MSFTWQHIAIIIVALAVVGTVGWFVMDEGQSGPDKLWFYDLNTGELYAGQATAVPPIDAPSGSLKNSDGAPAGVLASVIRIEGEEERKVAYLQSFTDEAKRLIEEARQGQGSPADSEKLMAGTLVALPPAKPGDPVKWHKMSTPDGYKVTMVLETISGGKPFSTDLP